MLAGLLDTLRAVFGRKRFESELDAELADHIRHYADELIAKGVPREQAEMLARREFGRVAQVKEEVRDSRAVTWVDGATRQVRFALRALWRNPVFTITAIVTLAVGLGASTAVFSVVNAVLLRDLPYPHAGQIYRLYSMTLEGKPDGFIAPNDMQRMYKDHPSVEAAAIGFTAAGQLIDGEGTPHNLDAYNVTEQYFQVFEVPFLLGESFHADRRPQVILSYSTWRDLFGSDPNIIGKSIVAQDGRRAVVGITPRGFNMPSNAAYWSYFSGGVPFLRAYDAYVRLRPGVVQARFQGDLKVLSTELGPDRTLRRNPQFATRPMLEVVVGELGPTVLIMFGAAAILLVIACINVANLMFARGIQRTRELAIREALGAKRGHVARALLTESLLLAIVGGVAGLGLAAAGVKLLMRVAPSDLPRLDTVPMDGTVLLFGFIAALVTGLLTGLAPAVRISLTDLRTLINDGGHGSSATSARNRVFGTLVVAEVALAVMLVISAGLLGRSYLNLSNTDIGIRHDGLVTAFMQVNTQVYQTEIGKDGRRILAGGSYEPVAQFYKQLMQRIRAIPGVAQVTAGTSAPLLGTDPPISVAILGRSVNDTSGALPQVGPRSVHPDYFRTMGMRLVRGRVFEESDTRNSPGVAVVNETFVKRFLTDVNPLGQSVTFPDHHYKLGKPGFQFGELFPEQMEIVGVVSDVKPAVLTDPVQPAVYLPMDQYTLRPYRLFVTSALDRPENLVPAIRAAIKEMDPTLGASFLTYDSILRTALARQRLGATLLAVFSGISLLLAAVGIYGLMSYSVAQRTREMAVRAAMGASGGQLRGLIVRRGLWLGGLGVVLGVAGAIAVRRVVATQLYEVSALDLRVFVVVPALLLVVAVLSSLLPALRAARADPATMLRSD